MIDSEEIFWHSGLQSNRNGHSFKKPIYDSSGAPLFLVCAVVDVTETKQGHNLLKLSEEKLRRLYEMAPVGIARNALDGRFIEANQQFSDMVGYSVEQLNEITYWDFTPEKYKDQEARQLELLKTVGKYGPYQKEFIHRNGKAIPVKLNGVLISDGTNEPYIWSFIEDISERVRLEETKSEFISTVSHELRTPLTSISGALSLVTSGVLGDISEQAKQMLDMAYRNSLQLTKLVNDLLEIDKLVAGKLEMVLQSQPLLPLIKQALELNFIYASKFDVLFQLSAADDIDLCAKVNGDRIIQVLGNLLSNAAKFSSPGSVIDVSVKRTAQNRVRVDVIDRGVGIADEFRSKIFQKFSQQDMSATKKVGGSGLGLAISKELIEHMNGVIGFESVSGQGSDFYFELPIVECIADPL